MRRQNPVLVGNSLGGYNALSTAAAYPDLVGTLACSCEALRQHCIHELLVMFPNHAAASSILTDTPHMQLLGHGVVAAIGPMSALHGMKCLPYTLPNFAHVFLCRPGARSGVAQWCRPL